MQLTKVCKVLPVTVLAPPHVDELVVAHDVAQGKGADDPSVPGRQDAAGVDAVQGGRNDAVEVAAQKKRAAVRWKVLRQGREEGVAIARVARSVNVN